MALDPTALGLSAEAPVDVDLTGFRERFGADHETWLQAVAAAVVTVLLAGVTVWSVGLGAAATSGFAGLTVISGLFLWLPIRMLRASGVITLHNGRLVLQRTGRSERLYVSDLQMAQRERRTAEHWESWLVLTPPKGPAIELSAKGWTEADLTRFLDLLDEASRAANANEREGRAPLSIQALLEQKAGGAS